MVFNEITKKAIEAAFENPGEVDEKKVDAQQTRRILDRLVGYKVSPILWEKVRRGLSAGRVQSVALQLICDREREIKAFVAEEYWTVAAHLEAAQPPAVPREPRQEGRQERRDRERRGGRRRCASDLEAATFTVAKVQLKERRRHPVPPFITSKLQQEAFKKLRFSVKKTMQVAQRLYEGVELGPDGTVGLITYMRTDSTRISDDALVAVREQHRPDLRRRVPAREAEHLQQQEGRAGRARGHPADLSRARSRTRSRSTCRRTNTRSTS